MHQTHIPPCDWIPPEFRQFVFKECSDEELSSLAGSAGWYDESGRHDFTVSDFRKQGIKKIIGVIDTRDGSFHPQLSQAPIMGVGFDG